MGLLRKADNSKFNAGILATFGKLDQRGIDGIDGRPERLVKELVDQYGWTSAEAQLRVDGFQRKLTTTESMQAISYRQSR